MKKTLQVLKWYVKTKYFNHLYSKSAINTWQAKQLKKQLQFVYTHSEFYQKHFSLHKRFIDFHANDLTLLPVINKEIMMENFDRLNTVGITKEYAFELALKAEETRDFSPMIGEITIGLSSGTSGNRGLFLVSTEERSQWAGVILAKLLPNGLLRRERIAFFLRANSNLYESVTSGRIQFQFFDLLESTDRHIHRLNEMKPSILVAPPSMLRLLAEQKGKKLLNIDPLKIVSVAEVLEPIDKRYIEAQFEQMVHQVYQCTEGLLGTTCEWGTMHLNEDLVMIEREYLDESQTKFVPIITDLFRTSQPIIKYRLNDILTLQKTICPCGSPLTAIEQIEGRCDDMFFFPKKRGEGFIRLFPDFIRRCVMVSSEDIQEYKVIQHTPELLEIQLKTKQNEIDLQQAIQTTFAQFIDEQGGKIPTLQFSSYQVERGLTKQKRIERRGEHEGFKGIHV